MDEHPPKHQHKCPHADCMYSGAKQHLPWGCEYAAVTRHSRVAWHRERGLSEEPQDCRLYEKGERPKRFTKIRPSSLKPRSYTTGKVRDRKRDSEPTVYRKRSSFKPDDHEKRLALYREGLNDTEIGKALNCSESVIRHWRNRNNLPTQRVLKQELEKADKERYKKLKAEEHERRLELYRRGLCDNDIAAALGVKKWVINKWRLKNNLPDQREVRAEKRKQLFVTLHEAGWGIEDCQKILHIGRLKVNEFQAELNLPHHSPSPSPETLRHREEVLQHLRETGEIK